MYILIKNCLSSTTVEKCSHEWFYDNKYLSVLKNVLKVFEMLN